MDDLIKRADAMGIIEDYIGKDYMTPMSRLYSVRSELSALPSAETHEIRTETHGVCSNLISRADALMELNGVCSNWQDDAKVAEIIHALPSAEAEPKWNCTANFVAEQLDRLRNMTDEERLDFLKRFFSPSAEADWIPCSERLPDIEQDVLATTTLFDIREVTFAWRINDGKWLIREGSAEATNNDILAWIPLPKPYRKDSEV